MLSILKWHFTLHVIKFPKICDESIKQWKNIKNIFYKNYRINHNKCITTTDIDEFALKFYEVNSMLINI